MDHEVGDIRPRDAVPATRDALGHDPIAARPRPVHEEDRPYGDPVELPLLEFLEHPAMLPIDARDGGSSHHQVEPAERRPCGLGGSGWALARATIPGVYRE